jgi:ankyrin repeat protein
MKNKRSLFYGSLFIVSLLFHSLIVNANNIINHNLLTVTEDTLNKKLYNLIYRCHSFNMNEEFLVQVEELIKQGANPNASLKLRKSEYKFGARLFGQYFKDKTKLVNYYSSPFHAAVLKKNVPLVQKMIDLGTKPNIANKNGVYPIELAMGNKDEPMIFCLLKNGVDIKKYSIAYGLKDQVIKKLLQMGADPNIPTKKGDYIINDHIFSDKDSSMAFLLIKHGADVNTIDLSRCFSVELTEKLVKMGANPKTININNAGLKNKESLNRILALKPDIKNMKIRFSEIFEKPELLDIFLDYGMSINVKSSVGNYPLIFGAVRYSNIETVNKLVKKGAKLTTLHGSETLLFHAVNNSRSDMVSFLLKKGANVNKVISGESILNQAAEKGNDEIINKLIDAGANIEFKSSWYKVSPLMTAVDKGNYFSVQTLIKRGANVNYKTPRGETALIYAINLIGGFNKYKSAIIKYLIKRGAKTNIKYKGQTLVEFAKRKKVSLEIIEYLKAPNNELVEQEIDLSKIDLSKYRNVTEIEQLVKQGANPKTIDITREFDNLENLERLLKLGPDIQNTKLKFMFLFDKKGVLGLLLDYGLDVNTRDYRSSTNLIEGAINYKDTESISKLIEKGLDIDTSGALIYAISKNELEMTAFLIKKGANVNYFYKNHKYKYLSKMPLISAIQTNNEKMINLLVDAGAEIEFDGYDGETPLMYAFNADTHKAFKALINKGANVNCTTKKGETPLILLIKNKEFERIQFLIEKGANLNAKENNNKSVLYYALETNNKKVIDMLTDAGAKIDHGGYGKDNPLVSSIVNERNNSIKTLVKLGADLNYKIANGLTPLFLAIKNKDIEIIKLLVENGADTKVKYKFKTPYKYAKYWHCSSEILEYLKQVQK